ncbi:hypothetical protein ACH4Q7_22620 [Streptomyces roseolus]|uniref:hypothetical protein n=1 Tax=Streptomyces roseolus TaxID=67358 RepID=UPI0037A347F4
MNILGGESVHRRTLLRGLGAAAIGVPAASLAGAGRAFAAESAETYHIALTEQGKNQVLIHARDKVWTPANEIWRWTPPVAIDEDGVNTWTNLADIRFRNTSAYGWIALVAAGYGKAGIINFGNDDTLLWSARPYGNPHAIEHIPHLGVTVVASSTASSRITWPGFLTVYAPTDVGDLSTLTRVQEIRFQDAHGLWYDGTYLWVLGKWAIARYRITGNHLDARLVEDWSEQFAEAIYGHSLDTDYSDPDYLLYSKTGAVKRIHKATKKISDWTPSAGGIKSYARVASGSSFWVQGKNVSKAHPWTSPYVEFFDSSGAVDKSGAGGADNLGRKGLVGYGYEAEFYRARVSSTDLS